MRERPERGRNGKSTLPILGLRGDGVEPARIRQERRLVGRRGGGRSHRATHGRTDGWERGARKPNPYARFHAMGVLEGGGLVTRSMSICKSKPSRRMRRS